MRAFPMTDRQMPFSTETEPLPAPALCTVGEVMVREVLVVHPDTSLQTAAELMLEHTISGMPVVDAEGQLLGMVSKTDLVRHRLAAEDETGVTLPSGQHVLDGTTVEDVMTRQVLAVPEGASLTEAAKLMIDAGIHRVLVVSPRGTLAGLVSTSDIVRWVAGLP
ncbi:CBS domain-containing protein [Archangium lansingense]|uniref:CBS domain-containing protein n=1 Tax=Archangium lansingense TaxID=2995310 RepID=A0ABT4A3R3_9BACT|nr:CBS domain-containing protein [Archangium lansinium]MCY1076289.1 CBS domain-containing protein [Archangium lansinium]